MAIPKQWAIPTNPQVPTAENFLNPMAKSYAMANQIRERNLLRDVGAAAAGGNYLDAAKVAMRGGSPALGMKMAEHQQKLNAGDVEKNFKVAQFFSKNWQNADTPGKQKALVDLGTRVFGPRVEQMLKGMDPVAVGGLLQDYEAKLKRQIDEAKLKTEGFKAKSYEALASKRSKETSGTKPMSEEDIMTLAEKMVYNAAPGAKDIPEAINLIRRSQEGLTRPVSPAAPPPPAVPQYAPETPTSAAPSPAAPVAQAPLERMGIFDQIGSLFEPGQEAAPATDYLFGKAPQQPTVPQFAPPNLAGAQQALTPEEALGQARKTIAAGTRDDPIVPTSQAEIDNAPPGTVLNINGRIMVK